MPEKGGSKERALLATNGANPDRWERLFLVASAKPAADALPTGEPGASKLDYGGFGTKPCLDHRGIGVWSWRNAKPVRAGLAI